MKSKKLFVSVWVNLEGWLYNELNKPRKERQVYGLSCMCVCLFKKLINKK